MAYVEKWRLSVKNNNLLISIDEKIENFHQLHMEEYHESQLSVDIPIELVIYMNKNNIHVNEFVSLCQYYSFDVLKVIVFKMRADVIFEKIMTALYPRPLFFCALCIIHPQSKINIKGFPRRCIIGILSKNKALFSMAKKIKNFSGRLK